jgi:hypothetical protein
VKFTSHIAKATLHGAVWGAMIGPFFLPVLLLLTSVHIDPGLTVKDAIIRYAVIGFFVGGGFGAIKAMRSAALHGLREGRTEGGDR